MMSIKSRNLQFFLLLLISIVLIFQFQCRYLLNPFETPKLALKKIEFQDISFTGMNLNIILLVDNPNSIGLTINEFRYKLMIEDVLVLDGHQDNKTKILGKRVSEINIPARVDFDGLSDSILNIYQKESLEYELNGYLKIASPIGGLRFNFEDYDFHKGKIPIPKVPKINVRELRIKEFSLTTVELELVFDLKNTNKFSFKLRELRYKFSLNQFTLSKARVQSDNELAPGEELEFKIPIKLKMMNLGKGILNILRQRRIKYKLYLNLIVDSDRGDIKLPLKVNGDIDLTRD